MEKIALGHNPVAGLKKDPLGRYIVNLLEFDVMSEGGRIYPRESTEAAIARLGWRHPIFCEYGLSVPPTDTPFDEQLARYLKVELQQICGLLDSITICEDNTVTGRFTLTGPKSYLVERMLEDPAGSITFSARCLIKNYISEDGEKSVVNDIITWDLIAHE